VSAGDNLAETESLTELQKAILVSLCKATGGSKKAHLPEAYFLNKPQFRTSQAKRAFKELISLGYIKKHPTRGETTYELTEESFIICKELRDLARSLK